MADRRIACKPYKDLVGGRICPIRDRHQKARQNGTHGSHLQLSGRSCGTIVRMLRLIASLIAVFSLAAQTPPAPTNGKRVRRLLIHNAIVIDGNGTPASGPKDIIVENN